MTALKWGVVTLCGLGAVGALAMGFLESRPGSAQPRALVPVALRPLPAAVEVAIAAPTPDAQPTEAATPDAPKPDAPTPDAPKPEAPKADAPKAEAPKAEAPKADAPKPEAPKPEAPKADPQPRPAPVHAAAANGRLNLRASDTADVYVDGRKVGSSPVLGFEAKAGTHRVRFDCYDIEGNAVAGPVKTVTVGADEEQDVAFDCPE